MNTEKRVILALVLSLGVIFLFNALGLTGKPKAITHVTEMPAAAPGQNAQPASEAAVPAASAPAAAAQAGATEGAKESQLAPAAPEEPEQTVAVDTDAMRVLLSSRGGSVKSIVLHHFGADKTVGEDLFPPAEPIFLPLSLVRVGEDAQSWKRTYTLEHSGPAVVMKRAVDEGRWIEKTLVVGEKSPYDIGVEITLRNDSKQEWVVSDGFDVACGYLFPLRSTRGADVHATYLLTEDAQLIRKDAHGIGKDPSSHGKFLWGGVKNLYYSLILRPATAFPAAKAAVVEGADRKTGVALLLKVPEMRVPAGGRLTQKLTLYAGPNQYDVLAKAGYRFTDILDFGWFSPLCILLLKMLLMLVSVLKNYGVAIIVLTVIIKVVLAPLTHSSMKSMKKMQAVQPQLTALREKYKNDPKKAQAEQMKIFKENGINPLGGCLPMLLQLPIFIAFYSTLQNSVELQGASFLWIRDLSAPDTVWRLGGVPLNVLPLIMGASTWWQQKMSSAQTAANPQSQTMMQMMPLIFTFMFYGFPSGLVLYWLMNNLLTIAQQYWMNRKS